MRRWSSAHAGAALVRSDAVHRKKRKEKSARRRVQTRSACKFKSVGGACKFKKRRHLSVGGVHACPESSALGAVVALVNPCCEAHLLIAGMHAASTFVSLPLLRLFRMTSCISATRASGAKKLLRQTRCGTHHAQDAVREQGAWAEAASLSRISLTQVLVAHALLAHPCSNALAPVCPERSQ